MKDALTMDECVELLGKSQYAVQRLIGKGELEPVYIPNNGKRGKIRLISVSSIARYVKSQKMKNVRRKK